MFADSQYARHVHVKVTACTNERLVYDQDLVFIKPYLFDPHMKSRFYTKHTCLCLLRVNLDFMCGSKNKLWMLSLNLCISGMSQWSYSERASHVVHMLCGLTYYVHGAIVGGASQCVLVRILWGLVQTESIRSCTLSRYWHQTCCFILIRQCCSDWIKHLESENLVAMPWRRGGYCSPSWNLKKLWWTACWEWWPSSVCPQHYHSQRCTKHNT